MRAAWLVARRTLWLLSGLETRYHGGGANVAGASPDAYLGEHGGLLHRADRIFAPQVD